MGAPHPFEDHTQLPALLPFGQWYSAIGVKIFFPQCGPPNFSWPVVFVGFGK